MSVFVSMLLVGKLVSKPTMTLRYVGKGCKEESSSSERLHDCQMIDRELDKKAMGMGLLDCPLLCQCRTLI